VDRTFKNMLIVDLAMHKPMYTVFMYMVDIIKNLNITNNKEWDYRGRLTALKHEDVNRHKSRT
jgi:hypothetical protein